VSPQKTQMQVPLLDLKVQHDRLRDELRSAIDEVCESCRFILGPKVQQFEEHVAQYLGAKHAIGVSSGTDALLCSLMALGVSPGDEVITTPFTFFATAGSIARLGAKPVFVDIEPDTFNIAPEQIEQAITPRTKVILPVHLFGQAAEMDPIMQIARDHGLRVVEDGAQAIGSRYRDQKVCVIGDLGCLSFFPSKNLGGFGDGGMIVTNDDALAEQCRILRAHGSKPKYYHKFVGGNFRLDALQAAVLAVKLRHLDEWHEARRRNAAFYDEQMASLPIQTPAVRPYNYSIYNQYTIRVPDGRRDALREHLKAAGIGTEIYYPLPLHLQECFGDLGYREGDLPASERAAAEVLSIPIYPELSEKQRAYVVDSIREFYAA